jgi:hypothetical protein
VPVITTTQNGTIWIEYQQPTSNLAKQQLQQQQPTATWLSSNYSNNSQQQFGTNQQLSKQRQQPQLASNYKQLQSNYNYIVTFDYKLRSVRKKNRK